jgi:uncharacterized membrane protein
MDLESAKNIGGVGALLLVITGIGIFGYPFVGFLGIVGLILVLVALKGMADNYNEAGIFKNALYFFIAAIIGVVAFIGTLVAALITFLTNLPAWAQTYVNSRDWQGLANAFRQHASDISSFGGSIWTLIGYIILALVILFVMFVIAMFFFRRSLGLLATKTNVGLFGTAGLLMLIGAALTIIVIGFLLIWIGWIMLTVAFFSVRATAQTAPSPPTSPTQMQ